ncbi:hypothetical protein Emed_004813 [Eimeria media]
MRDRDKKETQDSPRRVCLLGGPHILLPQQPSEGIAAAKPQLRLALSPSSRRGATMEGPPMRGPGGPRYSASFLFSPLLLVLLCFLSGCTGSSLLPSRSYGLHHPGGPPGAPGGLSLPPRTKVAFISSRFALLPGSSNSCSSSSSRTLTAHSSLKAQSSASKIRTNSSSSNSNSSSSSSEKPSARVLELAESARIKLLVIPQAAAAESAAAAAAIAAAARVDARGSHGCAAAAAASAAAAAAAQLKQQQGLKPEDELLLRLAVKSGGCSGLSYSLEFTKEVSV